MNKHKSLTTPFIDAGKRRRMRGLASVEFAIGIMVMIFMMLIVAEVGRLLYQYNILSQSVRNGARYASSEVLTGAGALDVPGVTAETQQLVVFGQIGGGDTQLPGFATGNVTVNAAFPSGLAKPYVTVAAAYDYAPLFASIPNFWAAGDFDFGFTLNSAITMRAVRSS